MHNTSSGSARHNLFLCCCPPKQQRAQSCIASNVYPNPQTTRIHEKLIPFSHAHVANGVGNMPHHISKNEKYEFFEPVIASWLHYIPSTTLAIPTHTSMTAMTCSTNRQVCLHRTQSHDKGGLNDSEEETTAKRSECRKRSLASVAKA